MFAVPKRCVFCGLLPEHESLRVGSVSDPDILVYKNQTFAHYQCHQKSQEREAQSKKNTTPLNQLPPNAFQLPLNPIDMMLYAIVGKKRIDPNLYDELDPTKHDLTWPILKSLTANEGDLGLLICGTLYLEKFQMQHQTWKLEDQLTKLECTIEEITRLIPVTDTGYGNIMNLVGPVMNFMNTKKVTDNHQPDLAAKKTIFGERLKVVVSKMVSPSTKNQQLGVGVRKEFFKSSAEPSTIIKTQDLRKDQDKNQKQQTIVQKVGRVQSSSNFQEH